MQLSKLFRWGASLALAIVTTAGGVSAGGGKPEIHVSSTAGLYDAVRPQNADTIVFLAPGTYTLDPTRADQGRLVLPPGMELIGARRHRGLESRVVVPVIGSGQGAIRIGNRNVVRWVTVEAPVFSPSSPIGAPVAAGACIDVGVLPPAPAGMSAEVTDCVLIGATRGIRVQHARGAANGRHSTVVLERNEVRDQGDSFEFGIQVQNAADGSTIEASLRKNVCTGARMGLFVAFIGVNGARSVIRSQGNVYADNECGIVLHGGRDAAAIGSFLGASDCRTDVTSIGDVITGNVGDALYDFGNAGGITVIGGFHMSTLSTPSARNHVSLTLRGTTFGGNVANGAPRDVSAFGGLGVGILPNGGNRVDVRLDDVTTEAPGTFAFSCSEPGQPIDEPPNTIEVVIDDEPVEMDCD